MVHVLLLDGFSGGSHLQLTSYLTELLKSKHVEHTIVTATDKKWHWRMRTSALYFADKIPSNREYSCVFATSVTNLAELVGLRRDLANAYKVLYFHENQLVYPVRKHQERDFQYGFNQIVASLAADVVLFNSTYNMTSFLNHVTPHLNLAPDLHSSFALLNLKRKCKVVYFPLNLPKQVQESAEDAEKALHIVWPHRWEHDKNPADFFNILRQMKDGGLAFHVSVIGQSYTKIPDEFEMARTELSSHILDWGFKPSKDDYTKVLRNADVVVSTAQHEFFGVSVLEAVVCGCFPLCPNRLVYPEIFHPDYLYNTQKQLFKRLREFCRYPKFVRSHKVKIDLSRFDKDLLAEKYLGYLTSTKSRDKSTNRLDVT